MAQRAVVEEPREDARASARADRVRRRRHEILRAAAELFQETGFHSATMHAVAERAGISVGLIYQYFGNKEDLLQAVIVDILGDFRDLVAPRLEAAGPDPEARLRQGYAALVEVIDEKREATVLAYRESKTLSVEGRTEVKKLEVETAGPFREAIVDGIRSGVFREVDADLVVHDLILTAHGWALKHWRLTDWLDRDTYIERQLDLVLAAIRA
ncbi:MAG TPA: TetR/AcrR family transcriptional regulator [Dermatophilaceae bacterium]|nr:TetR/AcrR family transcriptional regulator [Dermatophilaceae bacterium]